MTYQKTTRFPLPAWFSYGLFLAGCCALVLLSLSVSAVYAHCPYHSNTPNPEKPEDDTPPPPPEPPPEEPPDPCCDEDDECCDENDCKGTPAPILDRSGEIQIRDVPMWYYSGLGPRFEVLLKYEPSVYRRVRNDVGHNWSISYLSVALEKESEDVFWFYYGNGEALRFQKQGGVWYETLAQGTAYEGLLGKPRAGRHFWVASDGNTAVVTREWGSRYGFELKDGDYRLAWIGDRLGNRMTFHYADDTDRSVDYVLTADNRKFKFKYYSGYTNYPQTLINGKLASIEGPFALDGENDVSVPGVTRRISLSYMVQEGKCGTGTQTNYVVLAALEDMGGRRFEYDYENIYVVANQGRWNELLTRIRGPDGETTSIKYYDSPFTIKVFYPDQTWETVLFDASGTRYDAKYWNSDRGDASNPLETKSFVFTGSEWVPDETKGQVDALHRRTLRKMFDKSGRNSVITNDRPYLALKVYEEIVCDADTMEILKTTEYQFYKETNQLAWAQDDLTDPYQKWGHVYKVTERNADGDIIKVTTYEDLVVDSFGQVIGVRTLITDAAGELLSESKRFAAVHSWPTNTIAQWPAGYPYTYAILETNRGQRINATDWQEWVKTYDGNGWLLSEQIRIANTGNPTQDFAVVKLYTYYDEGQDAAGRIKEVWEPAKNAIEIDNILGPSPDYTGLKKTEYEYDFGGRVSDEKKYYYETHTSPPFEEISYGYDELNHKTSARYQDGTHEFWSYSYCGIASYIDRDGNTIIYDRDARRRITREVRMSARGTVLSDVSYDLDVDGRVISKTDGEGATTRYERDNVGRLVAEIDALGRETRYVYDLYDNRICIVHPNGLVERNFYDSNRQLIHSAKYASESDAALTDLAASLADTTPLVADDGQPIIVSYQYSPDGRLTHKYGPYKHAQASPYSYDPNDWSEKYEYDLAGRVTNTLTDDGRDGFYVQREYDSRARLLREIGPVAVGNPASDADIRTERCYTPAGLLLYTVSAPYIESNAPSVKKRRVVAYDYDFRFGSVTTTRVAVIDAGAPITPANLEALEYTEISVAEYDDRGRRVKNVQAGLTNTFSYSYADGYRIVAQTYPDGSTARTYYDGNRVAKVEDRQGIVTDYEYDKTGRRTVVREARTGSDGQRISTATSYDLLGRVVSVSNHLGEVTRYEYDPAGNTAAIIFPDGLRQFRHYNLLGLLIAQDGANTYPVSFEYDAEGRKIAMTDGNGSQTRWYYDVLGRLAKKCYDGHNESNPDLAYTYDLRGNLTSRTDAKGVVTRYWHDNIGRLRGVDYPDPHQATNLADFVSTPSVQGQDVRFTYDYLGRRTKMEDPTGTTLYGYEGNSGRVALEDGPRGKVQRTFEFGTFDKLYVGESEPAATYLVDYNYGAGRLTNIISGDQTFEYKYLADSYLLEATRFKKDGVLRLTARRTYDDANRILSVTNISVSSVTSVVSSFSYDLDAQGRRIRRTDADGSYIDYAYNERGELISAKRSTNAYDYGYTYDPIGNRLLEKRNEAIIKGMFNSWNQLTNRTFSGDLDYLGEVVAATGRVLTAVRVDGQDVTVTGRTAVLAGTVPIKKDEVRVTAVAEDSAGRKSSEALAFKTQEALTYDANGNLESDGRFVYGWNLENRLISVTPKVTNSASKKLEFTYDGLGRRVGKKVYEWDPATSNYELSTEHVFLYDGWNLIEERITDYISQPITQSTNHYIWGLDLSGSLQGAGGIGGLLSATFNASTLEPSTVFYSYDANGNVVSLVDADNGEQNAHYEYDPYGRTISEISDAGILNPFKFSTKYRDDKSDLLYYGYRFYNPGLGRWPSREPQRQVPFVLRQMSFHLEGIAASVQERHVPVLSGVSLDEVRSQTLAPTAKEDYLFVRNSPVQHIDYLGLDITCSHNYDCKCPPGSNKGKKQKKDKVTDGCSFLGIDNPSGIPGCSFLDACDAHDCCYGTCGSSKLACDAHFCIAMHAKCLRCAWWNIALYLQCFEAANIYCLGVVLCGEWAHSNNQKQHCEDCCCP